VRTWGELERAYSLAKAAHDGRGKREIGARMEAFATELKRDSKLDGLLRARGRELGVAEGSGLERLARAEGIGSMRELRQTLGLSQGHGMSMGR